jgi:hypothetical protein
VVEVRVAARKLGGERGQVLVPAIEPTGGFLLRRERSGDTEKEDDDSGSSCGKHFFTASTGSR